MVAEAPLMALAHIGALGLHAPVLLVVGKQERCVEDEAFLQTGGDTTERRTFQQRIYNLFGLHTLLDKYIILLSSGELRKYQLTRALLSEPRILIMDNPFIGLDKETRQQLRELLEQISKERALQIILVLAKDEGS